MVHVHLLRTRNGMQYFGLNKNRIYIGLIGIAILTTLRLVYNGFQNENLFFRILGVNELLGGRNSRNIGYMSSLDKPEFELKTGERGHLQSDMVKIFELPDSPFSHLEEIDPTTLVSKGMDHIANVHKLGLLHKSSFVYVTSKDGYILLVRRSPNMQVCPSSWMLVGEHTILPDDNPVDTPLRAIYEELNIKDTSDVIELAEPLTENPIYFYREYSPSSSSATDNKYNIQTSSTHENRQITYLWWINLRKNHNDIHITLNEEATEYMWVTVDHFKSWLIEDVRPKYKPTKDFCDDSISALLEIGVKKLAIRQHNQKIQQKLLAEAETPASTELGDESLR